MNKIKKILLSCFIFLICILSFGCSSVYLSTTLKSTGEIVVNESVDLSKFSNTILFDDVAREYCEQLVEAYKKNLIKYFSYVYDNDAFLDLEESEKFSYILKNNLNYATTTRDDKTGRVYEFFSSTLNNKILNIKIGFVSIYGYLMFFNPDVFTYDVEEDKVTLKEEYSSLIDVPMSGQLEESNNLFIKTYTQTFNPFYYNGEEPKLLKNCLIYGRLFKSGDSLIDVLKTLTNMNEEDVEYYYNFITPYKRVCSNGEITYSNGDYVHSWELKSIDNTISVWRNYANYVPWYITALVVGALTLMFSFMFVVVKRKIKKKKGLEN